jgi:predicted permease
MGYMFTQPWWPWRKRPDADFHAEIEAHLDLEVERLIGDGLDPIEARYAARRAFGNVAGAEERFHEAQRWVWLEQLRQDVRYALRTLRRTPTFVAATSLPLAIALGLTTVLFAIFNAYVLRPFAIHDPYRIYHVGWRVESGDQGGAFTWREYEEIRGRRDLFEGLAAHHWQPTRSNGRPLFAGFVSGNYFDTLRPRLRVGRALSAFDTPQAPSAVLSDQGWTVLFNRDPAALGRRVEINGQLVEIVGIMRPEFSGMDDLPLDVWMPLTMLPAFSGIDVITSPQARELTLFARLRSDVTPAQAEQALAPLIASSIAAQSQPGRIVHQEQVRAKLTSRATPNPLTFELVALLSPVFAAFGLVLVAASANVSSVMLARALGRHREIGIRLSIGATRGRVVRQLLTEAAIISTIAGLNGLLIASVMLRAGRWIFFATLPPTLGDLMRVVPLDIDGRVFLFAFGVAAAATTVAALLPALQATRLQLTDSLRGEWGSRLRRGILRNVLVVGQVTVSLILLIAAVTLARNGIAVAATDLGIDTRNVYSINQRGLGGDLIPAAAETLATASGVDQIAITSGNPLFGSLRTIGMTPSEGGTTIGTSYMFASPEYFSVLRIPLVRGRTFTAGEAQSEAHVALVSARTAAAFWPGADPIGRVLRTVPSPTGDADALAGYSDVIVVGVVKDVVTDIIYSGVDPTLVYLPTSRTGHHVGAMLVHTRESSVRQLEDLRTMLERIHVNRAAFEVLPLAELTEIMLYPLRVASWIGALLGVVALSLSVSGLYGLLMFVLGQRRREIGIRMALGASVASVVRLVMHQYARVTGIGVAIGLVFAFTALKLLSAAVPLRNVSILDGWSFAAGIALIAAASAFATFFPARRATKIDPAQTLRADA